MNVRPSKLRRAIPVIPVVALAPASILASTSASAQDAPASRMREALEAPDEPATAPTQDGTNETPPAQSPGQEPAQEEASSGVPAHRSSTDAPLPGATFNAAQWSQLTSLVRQFCTAVIGCDGLYGSYGSLEQCISEQILLQGYSFGVNAGCDAAILAEAQFLASNFDCDPMGDYDTMDAFFVEAERLSNVAYRTCYGVYNPFPGPLAAELAPTAQQICVALEACSAEQFASLIPQEYSCTQAVLYASDSGAFMLAGSLDEECADAIRAHMQCMRSRVSCDDLPHSLYELAYNCSSYDALSAACLID